MSTLLEPIETLGRVVHIRLEDTKKSVTLREGTAGVKVRGARRGEEGQNMPKLVLKLMWKKFSGNVSCYNFSMGFYGK